MPAVHGSMKRCIAIAISSRAASPMISPRSTKSSSKRSASERKRLEWRESRSFSIGSGEPNDKIDAGRYSPGFERFVSWEGTTHVAAQRWRDRRAAAERQFCVDERKHAKRQCGSAGTRGVRRGGNGCVVAGPGAFPSQIVAGRSAVRAGRRHCGRNRNRGGQAGVDEFVNASLDRKSTRLNSSHI